MGISRGKHPAVRWTEEMIAIQSVNPHYGEGAAGEEALAQYIEELCHTHGAHEANETHKAHEAKEVNKAKEANWEHEAYKANKANGAQGMQGEGLTVRRQPVLPGRENVIIELRTGRPNPVLLFEAHMDTVSLGNMPDPLTPIIRDGRLYGRGACDTKSSLAAMLYAVFECAKRLDQMSCDLVMCAAVDEEHEYRGLSKWMELNMPVTGAVVGEPTNNRIVIAHKGCARFKLTTTGVAAHSSVPHEGENAIYNMMELVRYIQAEEAANLAKMTHPLCGVPTIVVSTIQGGKQINIVPDHCEIEVDRRIVPGEDCDQVLEAFHRRVTAFAQERGFRVQMETLLKDYALDTPATAAIVRSAQQTALQCGLEAEPIGVSYGSDASKLQQVSQIPSIVFGPGSINQAHSNEEWVPLAEIEQAAEYLLQMALNYGKERAI